jgi:hypothetical protein
VACPIVYGSTAYQLGKKGLPGDYATHRWSLFVRGPNGEDVSAFVQKVAFTLHPLLSSLSLTHSLSPLLSLSCLSLTHSLSSPLLSLTKGGLHAAPLLLTARQR